ncbi:hypothetical protein SKAU_G00267640 [Synaphobranchus kaupii]|uniref:Uncharacterized protein n=1 Tax=Synaphobranchus kaupii TaxID=118154 RepID=A0A9Q1EZL7_SYNKA|nr:hypothetical protein SKAU_G00267640 [Synaphobranchus kaupii]
MTRESTLGQASTVSLTIPFTVIPIAPTTITRSHSGLKIRKTMAALMLVRMFGTIAMATTAKTTTMSIPITTSITTALI